VGNLLLKAGGDVITGIDQLEIKDADDLIRHLREGKPGETINMKIFRDGKFRDMRVTLQERPRDFRR
jgi:serine protease Do